MLEKILVLHLKFRHLMIGEEGQDLIEYGLLAALISTAAVAGIGHVANAVLTMFTNINSTLGTTL